MDEQECPQMVFTISNGCSESYYHTLGVYYYLKSELTTSCVAMVIIEKSTPTNLTDTVDKDYQPRYLLAFYDKRMAKCVIWYSCLLFLGLFWKYLRYLKNTIMLGHSCYTFYFQMCTQLIINDL